MEQILRPLLAAATWVLVFWCGAAWLKYRWSKSRRPVKERLLRSPGDHCRKRMEEHWNRIMLWLFASTLVPAVVLKPMAAGLPVGGFLLWAPVLSSLAAVPAFIRLQEYRKYELGLSGERAVGEELNQLMLEGYHVFHDYPAGPNWNIDHIVIGRSGVYAIETKTRRKKKPKDGGDDHKIIFDGKVLHFPCETSTCGLKQAQDNATGLADQLSKALAEPIHVQPILTFPGWFITRTGKNGVLVVNAKEIRRCIVSSDRPQLSPKQIEQIAFRIEEKCRDVEF